MVSKKRLDYGSNGFRAPFIPKAPRSIRKRCTQKNSVEDRELCAFELLAAAAGKLLQESESSVSSSVEVQLGIHPDGEEHGQLADGKALKESSDHGSCAESSFLPEISILEHHLSSSVKELSQEEKNSLSKQTSAHASSDVPMKVDCGSKLKISELINTGENATCEVGASTSMDNSFKPKVEGCPEIRSKDDKSKISRLYMGNTSTVKDPSVNSKLSLYRDAKADALMQKRWNNVMLGIRDDDDNSFRCKKSSTKIRPFRPQPRVGHRRIRKMLTSKYRKIAPKLKRYELHNSKDLYRRQMPTKTHQENEIFDDRYEVAYDKDTCHNSISNLPDIGRRMDKSCSAVMIERATGALDTVKGDKNVTDRHVKFSIKSLKVPEVYIEVPETASVGSLKRIVMEAVTAILGSGIHVGVVHQGKKVRDDNRTLQQAGISQSSNLDTLGFTLEPSLIHASPSTTAEKLPATAEKLPAVLPSDANQELPRCPATPMIDSGSPNALVNPPFISKVDDNVDTNELISSQQTPSNEAVPDSKALIPVSSTNSESLAVVPVNPKPKRNELSQRRARRLFSVSEVEALVEAVERLGTGRWRDVKMGAFENADHRTYVDLKDKWKTLVHTASISPHQRRGEPVPQELLDRVLSVHSYWSQHQSRQHVKQTSEN